MPKDKSANRIFVGYPWKTYRAHREKALLDVHKAIALAFHRRRPRTWSTGSSASRTRATPTDSIQSCPSFAVAKLSICSSTRCGLGFVDMKSSRPSRSAASLPAVPSHPLRMYHVNDHLSGEDGGAIGVSHTAEE